MTNTVPVAVCWS